MIIEKLKSGFITKFIFEFEGDVVEAVLYSYNDRVVICCSTQCGCRVGCKFCGTGNKFIRNLSVGEIRAQVSNMIKGMDLSGKRFQIMLMSMGEPFHNYKAVEFSIKGMSFFYPYAEILVSTIGVRDLKAWKSFMKLSSLMDKVGLQFSIHKSTDEERNKLIPYEDKLTLKEIRDHGIAWNMFTERPVFLNYCVDGTNCSEKDIDNLKKLFRPDVFNFTFSVICSKDETMKEAGFRQLDVIERFQEGFKEYNTRIFDPDAQDDIGGGCGQLWHFQNKYNENI